MGFGGEKRGGESRNLASITNAVVIVGGEGERRRHIAAPNTKKRVNRPSFVPLPKGEGESGSYLVPVFMLLEGKRGERKKKPRSAWCLSFLIGFRRRPPKPMMNIQTPNEGRGKRKGTERCPVYRQQHDGERAQKTFKTSSGVRNGKKKK